MGRDNVLSDSQRIGGMSLVMGMLNRWHDMLGLDRNDHHHENVETRGIRDRLDDDLKVERDSSLPPDMAMAMMVQEIMARSIKTAEPYIAQYSQYPENLLPGWVETMPSPLTRQMMAPFYHSIFNNGELEGELKHLAAYGLALSTGFEAIAEEELRIAEVATKDKARLQNRLSLIKQHYRAGEFEAIAAADNELALVLETAHLAGAMPVHIPGQLTKRLKVAFNGVQVCELMLACSIIGVAQRWGLICTTVSEYLETEAA